MKQTNQDKEIRKRIIDKMDKDGGMYTYIKFHKLENCLDIPSVNGLIEIDELTEIPILSERKRILERMAVTPMDDCTRALMEKIINKQQ